MSQLIRGNTKARGQTSKESPEMLKSTTLKHNKKRNVGLLNEFFARYIAKAILEKRDGDIEKAKNLFARHFQKGTEISRELKLFTNLFETRVESKEAANSLIGQVKEACKLQSQARIDLEKTALLHEINQTFGECNFFDQEITEYRDYATIQVLLNHWRGRVVTENLSEAAQLEDKLLNKLAGKQQMAETRTLNMQESEVDRLVVNLMIQKFNQRFGNILNEEQKKLLRLYVFSKDNQNSKEELVRLLESMKEKTGKLIETAILRDKNVEKVKPKLVEVRQMLQDTYQDTSAPDDSLVTFYMSVSKLNEELSNE
ncbi:MAG: hypothetical protein E6R04_02460 [Spirochaetes bacterium]|nr:MAG: hypothetical protein E6R04_02460 [Spirochaetota bacterium]